MMLRNLSNENFSKQTDNENPELLLNRYETSEDFSPQKDDVINEIKEVSARFEETNRN